MPIDRRRQRKVIAVIDADLGGVADDAAAAARVRSVLERLNDSFYPVLAEPFAMSGTDRLDGALADPVQAPSFLSTLREHLAPLRLRVGVGIGTVEPARDEGGGRDAFSVAHHALRDVIRDDGLTRYLGTGEAGDILLKALCRLVDPLIEARTAKQWEAIAAYRELGHQQAVAERLGVTRQSVGDRLAAGHRRAVEEADAAIATYLGHLLRQPFAP